MNAARAALIAVATVAVVAVVMLAYFFILAGDEGLQPVAEPAVKGGEVEMMEEAEVMVEVGPEVGQLAPDFTLQTIDGTTFSLSDFRGKTVVVWFMIPVGCPICVSQVEELKKLQEELGEDLVVIAVTILDYQGVEDDLAKFRDEKGLMEWFYAVDTAQLGLKYNIVEMGVIIVGPDGKILHRGIPQASFEEMLNAIRAAA